MNWDEFTARVIEAASKTRGNPDPSGNRKLTKVSLYKKPTPDKQCDFTSSKTGKRCGNWAMKGAQRCNVHGGYRQNPEHPGTVKRLGDILNTVTERRASKAIYHTNPKTRAYVEQSLRGEALPLTPTVVKEGIHAYEKDDNGRAYRRWLANAIKHKPQEGKRARKTQLREKRQAQTDRKM